MTINYNIVPDFIAFACYYAYVCTHPISQEKTKEFNNQWRQTRSAWRKAGE